MIIFLQMNRRMGCSPFCVYDTIQRKKICELKANPRYYEGPGYACFTEDGKYFFTLAKVYYDFIKN